MLRPKTGVSLCYQLTIKTALKMGSTINVCKELGEKVPDNVQIEFKVTFGKKYYLTTALDLNGRGIEFGGKNTKGKNTYFVTEKAMQKLETTYTCAYLENL